MPSPDKRRLLTIAAEKFFNHLGRHLPQQCASDEFYFLPRAEAALRYLDRLDDLSQERVEGHICYVRDLLSALPSEEMADPEEEIDRQILKGGMESFLREYGDAEVWRRDPTLYVKIPLFAVENALSRGKASPEGVKSYLFSVLDQIPGFLRLALKNLRLPPDMALQVASDMVGDAIHFHRHHIVAFIEKDLKGSSRLLDRNRKAVEGWQLYKEGLGRMPGGGSFAVGEGRLEKIIRVSLSYHRSPKEILELAREAFHDIREKIRVIAGKAGAPDEHQGLSGNPVPATPIPGAILSLYREEVRNLRRFFSSGDILSIPAGDEVRVLQTPYYLKSLRATASYRAPLTGSRDGYGIFYITPDIGEAGLIADHCPYLSAHETYPGHHILDHLRMNHPNPIRRQIESPLFYEGWSCYGERLLDELGYIRSCHQQIIQLQRQLWRCLRAILDVEIQSRNKTPDEAASDIVGLGFSPVRAGRQVRRFCLTPGYQLCYFTGLHEILHLRRRFSGFLGLKGFHDALLGGGQIPFRLVKERLTACKERK
ncbi:MAG: DUF885 family protein [Pseudomonadota bacterium]